MRGSLRPGGHVGHDGSRSVPCQFRDGPRARASSAGRTGDTGSSFTGVSRDYTTGSALGFCAVLTATKTDLTIEGHELTADGTDPIFDSLTLAK